MCCLAVSPCALSLCARFVVAVLESRELDVSVDVRRLFDSSSVFAVRACVSKMFVRGHEGLLIEHGVGVFEEPSSRLRVLDAFEDGADDVVSVADVAWFTCCLLYTSPSPRDATLSRMPSSA